ncbi:MAG: putative metal-binding motif-containing protein [Myxococcales bacterium]|nr:putative metal-binding motif-containing protein [Myxococcales bacterium]
MKLRLLILTTVALGLAFSSTAFAGNGKAKKVDICHPAGKSGKVLTLNVASASVPAHLAHGDWLPETFYYDNDGDGYGDPTDTVVACLQPKGTSVNGDDCNDDNAKVNPGATEVPYDGVDNDCNAKTPDDDLDGDGYGIAEDCNDKDASVNPGAKEIPHDGVDNDCNPETKDNPVKPCVKVLLHCNAGSKTIATVCAGQGRVQLPWWVVGQASYVVLSSSVAKVQLWNRWGQSMVRSSNTNLCYYGGPWGRWNDDLRWVQVWAK